MGHINQWEQVKRVASMGTLLRNHEAALNLAWKIKIFGMIYTALWHLETFVLWLCFFCMLICRISDDVMAWKRFPFYRLFMQGIHHHRWIPLITDNLCGSLMFSWLLDCRSCWSYIKTNPESYRSVMMNYALVWKTFLLLHKIFKFHFVIAFSS